MEVLASVEYDPVHAATHEFNFPLTQTVCADVSRLTAAQLTEAALVGWRRHGHTGRLPRIDVIFGGPPCQGYSTIGKRLIEDERNQLVFHFFRLVTEIRPRYFVMENVPGMLLGGHASILMRLREEFAEQGYETGEPQILNAADHGVPQDRRRVFLFGWDRRSNERPLEYPEPTFARVPKRSGVRASADLFGARPRGPNVIEAIGDLPDLDRYEQLLDTDSVSLNGSEFERMETAVADRAEAGQPYAFFLRHPTFDPDDFSAPRLWDPEALTSSMRTVHTELSISRFAATVPGDTEPVSRFFRLPADGLCNTLRAGTGSERGAYTSPRPIHPLLPRVISVREAARLHSFPDWFRLHQTKWHGFRQVGNAVPPLLGRAVARQVVRALNATPERRADTLPAGDPSLLRLTMDEAARHFGAERAHMPKKRARMAAAGAK